MNADKKIDILDDFFKFAQILKQQGSLNDNKKVYRKNKLSVGQIRD